MKKNIAILGSTGSIGKQALEVVDRLPHLFNVVALSAYRNSDLLTEQARKYHPESIHLGENTAFNKIKEQFQSSNIHIKTGDRELEEIICSDSVDFILNAMVGFAGLKPALYAIKAGKTVGLANKESLVVAGEILTNTAKETGGSFIPIDSEHSAIFQCLQGEDIASVECIYLTASGGPFRGKDFEFLSKVSLQDALDHPNWDMGKKITIDSATMMNKGLEVIEASWLFGLESNRIRVVLHPQSIIHSMVQFKDGSVKAQMSPPDMRMAIQYAMCYPGRTL
ncbi:MAG: 1-deoxy-D-xylulose-5-phosphate reductoisomerase, partial [Bacteroidales bacterium]|nr:1-deoxy-D-xylulose-5-phosphate reductoisomerase [Bacteroidales bacterium]